MLAFLNGVRKCNKMAATVSAEAMKFDIFVSKKIQDVSPTQWDAIVPKDQPFLKRAYLSVLEKTHQEDMEFRYAVFSKNDEPVGIAFFKIVNVSGRNLRGQAEKQHTQHDIVCPVDYSVALMKNGILSGIDQFTTRLMICGNAFISGDHGFFYTDKIADRDAFQVLHRAIEMILAQEAANGKSIGLSLVKDFEGEKLGCARQLKNYSYQEIPTHPNMVLYRHPSWQTFDNYLQSMQSKYRVRAKKVIKNGSAVDMKSLSLEEIKAQINDFYPFYRAIADKAGLNLAHASADYFVTLKEELEENYYFLAYYLAGKPVGFISLLLDGEHLEAHYMGADSSLNRSHSLYNNILFDVVKVGIDNQVKQIHFGRTAPEIKSTIGAVPVTMNCFLRHRNFIPNNIITPFITRLKQEEWTPRQPFKQEFLMN